MFEYSFINSEKDNLGKVLAFTAAYLADSRAIHGKKSRN